MENSPPEELIGNVYMIAEVNGLLLYVVQEDGRLQVPGGKKDPGETYLETIRREMIEEAGAELRTFNVFGGWHLHLRSEKPLKPHLPHPEMYMVVGWGQVDIVKSPTNPEGSHKTSEVKLGTIDEVVVAFESAGRKDLAELYQFAWSKLQVRGA